MSHQPLSTSPQPQSTIILVGLPGSGKSTVGRALAKSLELPFVDLDTFMEEEEGKRVPEIFSEKGEPYFRELEARCLRKVLDTPGGKVLATGGGAPCFHGNMEEILKKGISVYLEVSFKELAGRLFAEGVEKRPLLAGIKGEDELVKLLEEKFSYRIPFYQQADLHFRNTKESSPVVLLNEIKKRSKK